MCSDKCIIYWPILADPGAGKSKSFKALPKVKLASKFVISTVCWSVVRWVHTAFWMPAEVFYLRTVLTILMSYNKNCSAWSQHWMTEKGELISMTRYDQIWIRKVDFKSWWIELWNFGCCSCINLVSSQQTLTSSLATFWREIIDTSRRMQKMFSQSSLHPKAQNFKLQDYKNIYHWLKGADCSGSYFEW